MNAFIGISLPFVMYFLMQVFGTAWVGPFSGLVLVVVIIGHCHAFYEKAKHELMMDRIHNRREREEQLEESRGF